METFWKSNIDFLAIEMGRLETLKIDNLTKYKKVLQFNVKVERKVLDRYIDSI